MVTAVSHQFFTENNSIFIAKWLLGKKICSNINGEFCSAMITETEAYHGINDRASHAYREKRTKRNSAMYMSGGCIYIYLCYGLHNLFNIVTNKSDFPDAVLIRAVEAIDGQETMENRRKRPWKNRTFTNGPGKVSQALGLTTAQSGAYLRENFVWILPYISPVDNEIISAPRIGVDYAGADAQLPYRFIYAP